MRREITRGKADNLHQLKCLVESIIWCAEHAARGDPEAHSTEVLFINNGIQLILEAELLSDGSEVLKIRSHLP